MQKLTSLPNLDILSQKLANPLPNLSLHFLIGIPFLEPADFFKWVFNFTAVYFNFSVRKAECSEILEDL